MTDRPLSEHAFDILRRLTFGPIPSQQINPGVVDKFHREGLSVTIQAPSPYKKHKGSSINHEQLTGLGRARLQTKRPEE